MIKLDSAQHVGRDHRVLQKNLQDALVTYSDGDQFAAGVIMDGVSEGTHSEAGASLAAAYLMSVIRFYHESYPRESPYWMSARWTGELDYFLQKMLHVFDDIASKQEKVALINHYFLFTIVGFVWTPEQAVIFYCGDGMFAVDDHIVHLPESNTPSVFAYREVPDALPKGYPKPVIQVEVYDGLIKRLAIGSDAWKDEKEFVLPVLGTTNMQRAINVLSDHDHHFKDDVSIIRLEAE